MPTLESSQLETITLYYREGSSDKVYQVRIEPAGERFVVHFAYGRRGSTLNTGTKTNVPVEYDRAKRIFAQLIQEKKAKGYTEGETGIPYLHAAAHRQPSGVVPQLLNPISENQVTNLLQDDDWCLQEKHDGRRLLIRKQGDQITGINKKGLETGLPVSVFKVIHEFKGDFLLDGESMGDRLIAFDLLAVDGMDIRNWPYRERLAALMNLLFRTQQRIVQLVDTAFTSKQKTLLLQEIKAGKREGMVFKQVFARYTAGRPNSGGNQLKYKFVATLSAVVSKINPQRSVELQLLNPANWQVVGNVTIPSNHAVPPVGAVIEVQYLYAFPDSGILYQPVYLGRRTEVEAGECVVSQLKFKPEEA